MLTIDIATEAGAKLEQMMKLPGTYTIRIDERGPHHVALKRNEGMWTHTMRANFEGQHND